MRNAALRWRAVGVARAMASWLAYRRSATSARARKAQAVRLGVVRALLQWALHARRLSALRVRRPVDLQSILRRAARQWRALAATRQRATARLGAALRRWRCSAPALALSRWQLVSRARNLKRHVATAAVLRWRQRDLSRAFSRWRTSGACASFARHVATAAVLRWRQRGVSRALASWHSATESDTAARDGSAAALRRWTRRGRSQAFDSWRRQSELRASAQRAMARAVLAVCAHALLAWGRSSSVARRLLERAADRVQRGRVARALLRWSALARSRSVASPCALLPQAVGRKLFAAWGMWLHASAARCTAQALCQRAVRHWQRECRTATFRRLSERSRLVAGQHTLSYRRRRRAVAEAMHTLRRAVDTAAPRFVLTMAAAAYASDHAVAGRLLCWQSHWLGTLHRRRRWVVARVFWAGRALSVGFSFWRALAAHSRSVLAGRASFLNECNALRAILVWRRLATRSALAAAALECADDQCRLLASRQAVATWRFNAEGRAQLAYAAAYSGASSLALAVRRWLYKSLAWRARSDAPRRDDFLPGYEQPFRISETSIWLH